MDMPSLLSRLRPRRPPWTPFERRKRSAARIALYGSLALVGVVLALGYLVYLRVLKPRVESLPWVGVDYASMPDVQLLQRYLRIDTTQPDAEEEVGARFLASVLAEAGISSTLELMGDGHANLWAWLDGESPEAVVLHNHIDTDPVGDDEVWTHGPFSGTIEPPYIYGRGAYDMKSIAVAQLRAMIELAKSPRPLKRSVLFLATGSEEVGSDLGTRWILRNRPELASRFWVFLTEGGVVETRSRTEVMYWGIEFAQKRYVDVWVCAPEPGVLEDLRQELLDERAKGNAQVRLAPEVAAFLKPYAPTRHRPLYRQLLADPRQLALSGPDWAELPIYLKAMFRDEAIPFPVEAVPGGGYRMLLKFHLLPGTDFEQARQRLLPAWRTHGLTVVVYDEGGADHGSPLDHPAYTQMVELLRNLLPEDAPVGPLFLPWTATDSRFVRARGIPAYGFSPFLISSTDTFRIGYEDERMYLPGFVDGVKLYQELVRRLVQ